MQKISKRTASNWSKKFLKRRSNSHKYDFGHVLVLAGSQAMPGAGALSAWSALKSGAGLVTLALPQTAFRFLKNVWHPEIMLLPLKEGASAKSNLSTLHQFILKRKVTSIVLGPGLGNSSHTEKLVVDLIKKLVKAPESLRAVILDADGFLFFATPTHYNFLKQLPCTVVTTPHSGEAARWLKITAQEVEKARARSAQNLVKCYNGVCVLKGPKSLVASSKKIYENSTGNAGMATAGSGDVLSGILGALLGVKREHLTADLERAALAVYIHGQAADRAARAYSQTSLTASNIVESLPKIFLQFEKQ